MFKEYPKMVGVDDNGKPIIVANKEEEEARIDRKVSAPPPEVVDYESMDLDSLKEYARSIGIRFGNIGRATLLEKIEEALTGGE